MNKINLLRTAAPSAEPVTAANVKTYTRIDVSTDDYLIDTWIRSGRIKAENYQRKSYITQSWQLTVDALPSAAELVYLPRGPIQGLTSVTYMDIEGATGTVDVSEFLLDSDTGLIRLKYDNEWPTLDNSLYTLKYVYTAGYGDSAADVPEYVLDALYLYCAYRYENRLGETDVVPRVFYQILDEERCFRGLES